MAELEVRGAGDREALVAMVFDTTYELVAESVGVFGPTGPLAYYLDEGMRSGADDERLWWTFSDLAGCCGRSAQAWDHWVELTIAAGWERFAALAEGLEFTTPRPVLAELLSGQEHLVTLRDDLWIAGPGGLHGDDAYLPLTDLTAGERELHASALQTCRCGLCYVLRQYP